MAKSCSMDSRYLRPYDSIAQRYREYMELLIFGGLVFILLGVLMLLYLRKYPIDSIKFLGVGAATIRPRAWLSLIVGTVIIIYSLITIVKSMTTSETNSDLWIYF